MSQNTYIDKLTSSKTTLEYILAYATTNNNDHTFCNILEKNNLNLNITYITHRIFLQCTLSTEKNIIFF